MTSVTGRHRKRGLTGLIAVGALVALGLGFLGGFGTGRYLLNGGDSGAAAAATSATQPSSASSPAESENATGSPAPPDPVPPPDGEKGFLQALTKGGAPVDEHRDVLLLVGRAFCELPKEERENQPAAAERIVQVLGGVLTQDDADLLVSAADEDLC